MKFDFLRRAPIDHHVSLNDGSKYQITLSSLIMNLHLMHLEEVKENQFERDIEIKMYSTCLFDGEIHDKIECHSEFSIELKNKIENTITELFENFVQFQLELVENKRELREIRSFLDQKFDLSLIRTMQIELAVDLIQDIRKLVVDHAIDFRIQKRSRAGSDHSGS